MGFGQYDREKYSIKGKKNNVDTNLKRLFRTNKSYSKEIQFLDS